MERKHRDLLMNTPSHELKIQELEGKAGTTFFLRFFYVFTNFNQDFNDLFWDGLIILGIISFQPLKIIFITYKKSNII